MIYVSLCNVSLGTERSYVAMDYREMMNSGKRATDPVITDILAKLVGGNSALSNFTLVQSLEL